MSEETLLDYLNRPNPTIVRLEGVEDEKPPKKSNTNTRSWNKPTEIARWKEFDFETMMSIYDKVLRCTAVRKHISIESNDLKAGGEEGIGRVIGKWNRAIVCEALEESRQHYQRPSGVTMVFRDQAQEAPGPSCKVKYRPDWATILTDMEQSWLQKPPSIMPGDTKCSWKWTSHEIREGPVTHVPKQWMLPLSQIFTYCLRLKTRYGYLITDEELVVVRVGPCEDSPRTNGPRQRNLALEQLESNGKLEFESIAWNSVSRMSVNMALWWMHLQAASKRSIEFEYPALETEAFSSPQQIPAEEPIHSDTPSESAFAVNDDRDDPMLQSFNSQRSGLFNTGIPKPVPKRSRAARSSRRGQNDTNADSRASLNTSFVSSTSIATDEPGSFSSQRSKRKGFSEDVNPKGPLSGKRRRTRMQNASFTSQDSMVSTTEEGRPAASRRSQTRVD